MPSPMSISDLGSARSVTNAPRVTVVTAPFDAHHERLFCGGFLERLAARGALRWSSTPYEESGDGLLDASALLVLVRPRFPEVTQLLDGAAARGLPVLNIVDDNWLAAGREYARFEALFTPGKPALETFLEALRRADATAVFNPVLAEDVRPHARRVVELPPSVDLELFAAPSTARAEGFVVGYAGSPRWEGSGFAGLAAFLARHADARLLVMAHEIPEALRGADAGRLSFVPWQRSYADYARALAAAAPDVLIAPLDATRFTASKVPFKLFDSAAVGAAGIYSRVPPYTRFVRDGENGLLVDNEPAAWERALERLAADAPLRRRLADAALRDVRSRFTTEHALPAFLALLAELLPGRLPVALPEVPPR